jgi:hypothetical protein
MNPLIRIVLIVYSVMMLIVVSLFFAPAKAQIVIEPPFGGMGHPGWGPECGPGTGHPCGPECGPGTGHPCGSECGPGTGHPCFMQRHQRRRHIEEDE